MIAAAIDRSRPWVRKPESRGAATNPPQLLQLAGPKGRALVPERDESEPFNPTSPLVFVWCLQGNRFRCAYRGHYGASTDEGSMDDHKHKAADARDIVEELVKLADKLSEANWAAFWRPDRAKSRMLVEGSQTVTRLRAKATPDLDEVVDEGLHLVPAIENAIAEIRAGARKVGDPDRCVQLLERFAEFWRTLHESVRPI
jgi:hypothetical protein